MSNYPPAMTIHRTYRTSLANSDSSISQRLFRLGLRNRPQVRRGQPDAHRSLGKRRHGTGRRRRFYISPWGENKTFGVQQVIQRHSRESKEWSHALFEEREITLQLPGKDDWLIKVRLLCGLLEIRAERCRRHHQFIKIFDLYIQEWVKTENTNN